ncbi:MAG: hypothetical protein K2Q20_00405 [Phycisphaerales bacterium]|nr:hypothetical protein [Phycisphaerales bacterium]
MPEKIEVARPRSGGRAELAAEIPDAGLGSLVIVPRAGEWLCHWQVHSSHALERAAGSHLNHQHARADQGMLKRPESARGQVL